MRQRGEGVAKGRGRSNRAPHGTIQVIVARFLYPPTLSTHLKKSSLMPLPIVAAVFGNAVFHILTKPGPWIAVAGFVIASKFNLGVFADELRTTVWSFWPFVLLAMILYFGLQILKAYWEIKRGSGSRDV